MFKALTQHELDVIELFSPSDDLDGKAFGEAYLRLHFLLGAHVYTECIDHCALPSCSVCGLHEHEVSNNSQANYRKNLASDADTDESISMAFELDEWRQVARDLARSIAKSEDDVHFAKYILKELSQDEQMRINPLEYK